MKKSCLLIVLILAFANVNAQKIQEIASKNIDEAIPMFNKISDFKNTDDIKLLGLGDVADLAKETKKLNTAFTAYLIIKKNFRNIVIPGDDWMLRPLNAYMTSSAPADSAALLSLLSTSIPPYPKFANTEFFELIAWIKKYNLAHRQDMVNFFGVAPNTAIPPSYFLSAYVYAIDKAYGQKLSDKWSENTASDSVAYADIKTWLTTVKSTGLSKDNQALVAKCNADLLHNKAVVKILSIDQKFPPKILNDRARYIANRILEKLDKKTIFYGSNVEVMRADLASSMVLNNTPVYTAGKCLGEDLREKYNVFITDFTDTAKLPMVYFTAKKINDEVLTGPEKAKDLYKNNDYLDDKKDKNLLKGYQPELLPYLKEQVSQAVVDKDGYAADGLFLLSNLSKIDTDFHF
ncbi:erythromycin esterase family protein [Mucilaginibacter corticis]|uniref:Erythromycin esterase family protein n=1 Tax=Mucilaginibacter corticis TaxID=2597670 RepID=A0A556MHP0_9SPHI|nr:erythromycin esterase family protein [Mucilaginibacter corticis]TSJ39427.1 erythromycin esterase family protein [Mucilaginibacter corticis]